MLQTLTAASVPESTLGLLPIYRVCPDAPCTRPSGPGCPTDHAQHIAFDVPQLGSHVLALATARGIQHSCGDTITILCVGGEPARTVGVLALPEACKEFGAPGRRLLTRRAFIGDPPGKTHQALISRLTLIKPRRFIRGLLDGQAPELGPLGSGEITQQPRHPLLPALGAGLEPFVSRNAEGLATELRRAVSQPALEAIDLRRTQGEREVCEVRCDPLGRRLPQRKHLRPPGTEVGGGQRRIEPTDCTVDQACIARHLGLAMPGVEAIEALACEPALRRIKGQMALELPQAKPGQHFVTQTGNSTSGKQHDCDQRHAYAPHPRANLVRLHAPILNGS